MFDKLKEIIRDNSIDDIYLTGIVDVNDDGIAEFVANTNFLYFEFGNQIIEFESIDGYSRLCVSIVDSIKYQVEFEDVKPCSAKISEIIFTNPLETNKVSSICFFNLDVRENELICDVLHIKLSNGQDIFIDPAFLGINVGGLEQKNFWQDSVKDKVVPKEIYMEF